VNVLPDGPEWVCAARTVAWSACAAGFGWNAITALSAQELIAARTSFGSMWSTWRAGLKACIMLLNPERIVIGGGISKAGDALFGALREELRSRCRHGPGRAWMCSPHCSATNSVLYGALGLAMRI